ncbi:hypothetical protein [Pseudomonas guariconensis]|uniref:hypothetical protein n=1 Tax=Pseudomonas guariconensis TaxID=1288410 RepID=UPI0034661DE4
MQRERRLERRVKKTLEGVVEAGEQLIREAIEATRAYHQAEAEGRPAVEIERLRLIADSLYQAVTEYQLRSADDRTRH